MLKYLEKVYNMTKEKFEEITNKMSDIKNISNYDLIDIMDNLTLEFDSVRQKLIEMTFYLDKLELLYNNTLKEFESRNNE
jgi:hypothetical protein